LPNFNTDNVKDMSYMFSYCSSLKELNLSNFNTNNVKDMSHMFDGCKSLKILNLINFKIAHHTDIYYMFCNCLSFKELYISSSFYIVVKKDGYTYLPDEPKLKIKK